VTIGLVVGATEPVDVVGAVRAVVGLASAVVGLVVGLAGVVVGTAVLRTALVWLLSPHAPATARAVLGARPCLTAVLFLAVAGA
jgi:hypothetical protein